MDVCIKAKCAAQVIPSAYTIAVEVSRHGLDINVEQHGAGVSRKRWMDHNTLPNVVRDSGMVYRGIDNEGRKA